MIRHGETDFNRQGIVQGRGVDSSINETGKLQAKSFHSRYRAYPFDKVYISTLQRTHQTVSGFLDEGLPSVRLEGLDEINWGHREGQAVTRGDHKYYRDVTSRWKKGETNLRIEGGESPDDVASRLKVALTEILADPGQNILICTHGRTMRILMTMLFNYPMSAMDYFPHENVCLYNVLHTGSMFRLQRYEPNGHRLIQS